MRAPTRTRLVLAASLVVVALPTVASGAFSAQQAPALVAANSTTYQDSVGENSAAPDITTITVSNTDAGLISFRVVVPNRPQFTQDMLIGVEIDTDNNAATGSPDGTDYAIELLLGEIFLYRWDGTNFTRRAGDPPATSLRFAYQGGVTITINRSQLGNTRAFRFGTVVFSGLTIDPATGDLGFESAVADSAPAATAGLYEYEVKITPPTLVVRSLKPTPKSPTAGQAFTLRLVAARSDTNAVVQNGRVTCVGRIGKARLRAQLQRVQGGAAVCTWNIPAGAKGKTFRGSVTVAFEGLRAQRAYSAKVR